MFGRMRWEWQICSTLTNKRKKRNIGISREAPRLGYKTVYVYSSIEVRLCNHCCCGKAINITYSEFVYVALGSQHEKCIRRIILSSVACSDLPNFSTYLINGTILEKLY